ncbi:MAG: CAP domain-containing protein [bacterium]
MKKRFLLSGLLVLTLLLTATFSTGAEAAWWLSSPPGGGSSLSKPSPSLAGSQTGTVIKLGGGTTKPSPGIPGTSRPPTGTPGTAAPGTPGTPAPSAGKGTGSIPGTSGNVINLSRNWSAPAAPEKPTTPTTPATPPSPPADPAPETPVSNLTAQEEYLLSLINKARASEGLAPLQADLRLVHLARLKAQDLVEKNYFDHNSPTYGSPFEMMHANGVKFRYAGENIAESGSVGGAHAQLMTSPGHRAHIMEPHYTHVGIGVFPAKPAGVMVVEMFIGN